MAANAIISDIIDTSNDIIDVRDMIARIEELQDNLSDIEELRAEGDGELSDEVLEEQAELNALKAVMEELQGQGGDEKWEGDWYPLTLIRDSYFEVYAQELVEDIGDMPNGIPNYIVIDWEATARNIQQDYTTIEIEGVTYWFR